MKVEEPVASARGAHEGPMSGHTLKYFMWSWQHQFHWLAADNAKRLLKPLDAQQECDAFLVGFFRGEIDDCHPICVSPDDCHY